MNEIAEFYKEIYYQSLQDREYIQSRLRLFLGLSISSFGYVYLVLKLASHYFIFQINVNYLFAWIIAILHIFIFFMLFNIFKMQDYEEMPEPKGVEDHRKAKLNNGEIFETEKIIINYYSVAASNNVILNQKRREMLGNLVILYFVLGGLHFLWFMTFLVNVTKG